MEKLQALGFNRQLCIQALQLASDRLDEASNWLFKQEENDDNTNVSNSNENECDVSSRIHHDSEKTDSTSVIAGIKVTVLI